MKKLFYLLPFTILFISCNKNKGQEDLKVYEISAQKIDLSSPELLQVEDFFLMDTLLVTLNRGEDKYFKVFDLRGEYLGNMGRKGNGPEDYMNLVIRTFDSYKGQIIGVEGSSNKLHFLKAQINQEGVVELSGTHEVQIPLRTQFINDAVLLKDSILIGQSNSDSLTHDLFSFHLANGNIKEFGLSRESASFPNESTMRNYELNFKKILKKPDGNRFAVLHTKYNKTTIYDANLNMIAEKVVGSDLEILKSANKNEFSELKNYNLSITASNDLIFGLTLGLTNGELSEFEASDMLNLKPVVYAWSWDGKPVGLIQLDRPISLIYYHKETNSLYGINPYIDNQIFKYELPEIEVE